MMPSTTMATETMMVKTGRLMETSESVTRYLADGVESATTTVPSRPSAARTMTRSERLKPELTSQLPSKSD
ncbi:MAG: hypothetical protein IPG17_34055 [Sandaracinaceae bacterium]|nr:hypothetical protein [Sandaracinaceae bacterium]